MEGKEVKSDNLTWKITEPVNCETENCVYMIEFKKEKCEQSYKGETERILAKLIHFNPSGQS